MTAHIIEDGEKSAAQKKKAAETQPPPEEDLGGGDICSVEQSPSTEDDKPLD